MTHQNAKLIDQPVCSMDDLPIGKSRGLDPLNEGRDTMFIIRQGSRVYAYRNNCPHYDNARMAWRKDEFLTYDRKQIMCAAHGAVFAISTGYCEAGPCVGDSLERVDLTLRDGQIYITGPYLPGMPKRVGNGAKS